MAMDAPWGAGPRGRATASSSTRHARSRGNGPACSRILLQERLRAGRRAAGREPATSHARRTSPHWASQTITSPRLSICRCKRRTPLALLLRVLASAPGGRCCTVRMTGGWFLTDRALPVHIHDGGPWLDGPGGHGGKGIGNDACMIDHGRHYSESGHCSLPTPPPFVYYATARPHSKLPNVVVSR